MKIKTDRKIYHKGKVYINNKRRSNIVMRQEDFTIGEALREIDTTFNKYGLFTKCDRIVGLIKRKFDKKECMEAIKERINIIPDKVFAKALLQRYEHKAQQYA